MHVILCRVVLYIKRKKTQFAIGACLVLVYQTSVFPVKHCIAQLKPCLASARGCDTYGIHNLYCSSSSITKSTGLYYKCFSLVAARGCDACEIHTVYQKINCVVHASVYLNILLCCTSVQLLDAPSQLQELCLADSFPREFNDFCISQ